MRGIIWGLTIGLAVGTGGIGYADAPLPNHKPGLWVTSMVMHMSMAGQPPDTDNTPMIMALCSDAATDAKSWKMMLGGIPGCQTNVSKSGNVYTFGSTCPNPGGSGQMLSSGTITVVSETEIQTASKTTGPSMSGDMTGDSKWQGACPAGMAPGDFGHMVDGNFEKQGNLLTTPGG